MPKFSTIDEAVQAIRRGEVVIVLDAEDRENEGDFICAAEAVTPDIVNLMVTHGRGMLCMPILPDLAERLELARTPGRQHEARDTAYGRAIDHRTCHTGIPTAERALTIQKVLDPASTADDFVDGHVMTLVAKEGGVLRRAGHTEATVDLARLADMQPAGVLCEILDDTGDRADRDFLFDLAQRFGMPIITIEELIRYRRRSEKLVHRVAEARLPTRYGDFRVLAYEVDYELEKPIVLVKGDLTSVAAPLVRVHSSCFTGDLVESLRCDCGDQLHMALAQISDEGTGVLVYLQQEGRGIGIVEKIKAYALQDEGLDTVEANLALGFKADSRDYGIGIQLLKDLGLSKVRLLTNNPKKTDAFIYGGFDLEVVGQMPLTPPVNEHNRRYIATKRDKLGHALPEDVE